MFYDGPRPGEKRKYEFPLSEAQNKLFRCLRARGFPEDIAVRILLLPLDYGWAFCRRVDVFSPERVVRVASRLYVLAGPDVSERLKEIVDLIAYRWFISEAMSVLVTLCDDPPLGLVRCVGDMGLLVSPERIAVFLVSHGITSCRVRQVELRPAEHEILLECARKMGLVGGRADA